LGRSAGRSEFAGVINGVDCDHGRGDTAELELPKRFGNEATADFIALGGIKRRQRQHVQRSGRTVIRTASGGPDCTCDLGTVLFLQFIQGTQSIPYLTCSAFVECFRIRSVRPEIVTKRRSCKSDSEN